MLPLKRWGFFFLSPGGPRGSLFPYKSDSFLSMYCVAGGTRTPCSGESRPEKEGICWVNFTDQDHNEERVLLKTSNRDQPDHRQSSSTSSAKVGGSPWDGAVLRLDSRHHRHARTDGENPDRQWVKIRPSEFLASRQAVCRQLCRLPESSALTWDTVKRRRLSFRRPVTNLRWLVRVRRCK